jgi:hypothetical protein
VNGDDIGWTFWLSVFFFFVGLILLNMIAGLIVDTFTGTIRNPKDCFFE